MLFEGTVAAAESAPVEQPALLGAVGLREPALDHRDDDLPGWE